MVYEAPITGVSDDFTKTFVAGNLVFQLHFRWDNNAQEQWDILDRAIQERAAADPLIDSEGNITRDYSWLDWHSSWTEAVAEYPQSMREYSESYRQSLLFEQKYEAQVLKKIYNELTDRLAWYFDVLVDNTSYTGVVRPKGWLYSNDGSWAIMFDTALDKLTKDTLTECTLVAEVF